MAEADTLICPYCETLWPAIARYRECPRCLERTLEGWCRPRKEPLSLEAAHKLTRHAEFGWHLMEQWLSETVVN